MSKVVGHPDDGKKPNLAKKKGNKKRKRKEFDFSRFGQRHIALRIAYLGWSHGGFAAQDSTDDTIEGHLFSALLKTCLIASRETCHYSRAGRTDKGVSALGQVVALTVRSNLTTPDGPSLKRRKTGERFVFPYKPREEVFAETDGELQYSEMLNSVLPDTITVLAWSPVASDFDARFSVVTRSYRYLFLREKMDIDRMNAACRLFEGSHDFRNFCKIDAVHVDNYKRRVTNCSAHVIGNGFLGIDAPELDLCELRVTGFAFLWHQIRCMAAVLFLVGRGLEAPGVVTKLLERRGVEGRPNYTLAPHIPLILSDCAYASGDVAWFGGSDKCMSHLVKRIMTKGLKNLLKGTIIAAAFAEALAPDATSTLDTCYGLFRNNMVSRLGSHGYTPLLEMQAGDSLTTKKKKLKDKAPET